MTVIDVQERFRALVVEDVVPETQECRSVVLAVPADSREIFRPKPGQFLTVRATIEGRTHIRCYSASSVHSYEPLRITIKRVEGGTVSRWLTDSVKPGDTLMVAPPAGRFLLQAIDGKAIFLAAGSGITPILPMIRHSLEIEKRNIALLYWNRSQGDAIFALTLRDLAERFPKLFEYVEGYGTRSDPLLSASISEFASRHRGSQAYLCGPDGFMSIARSYLAAEGFPKKAIWEENFGGRSDLVMAPRVSGIDSAENSDVVVHCDGKRHEFRCRGNQVLLEALLAAGLSAPHSCKQGHCGACIVRLVKGDVAAMASSALSRRDRQRRLILACRSTPAATQIELSYDF